MSKSDTDEKSKKTLEAIKNLFGESHAECRDLIQKLQTQLNKGEISVSQEEALKLVARHRKDVTILD